MIRLTKLFVVLALVASMVASSQAEICPMKLQGQRSDECGGQMVHAHRTARHATRNTDHDCCPSRGAHQANKPKCPPLQLSACSSGMTCCSLDQQPADTPTKAKLAHPDAAAVATIAAALPRVPPGKVGIATTLKLEHSVFRHKEDLRI